MKRPSLVVPLQRDPRAIDPGNFQCLQNATHRICRAAINELELRTEELFRQHQHQIYVRIDRLFAVLMIIQWVASLTAAFWLSPRSWVGATSQTHFACMGRAESWGAESH